MTQGHVRTNAPSARAPEDAGELARLLVAVRRARVVEVAGQREAVRPLVLAAAERLASNFLDGVAVVELEHPHGLAELWTALGCVQGMPFLPVGTGDPVPWLAGQDVLLVLDGSDHLSAEARIWLQRLLEQAPGVRLLTAGQHPLGLGGLMPLVVGQTQPSGRPPLQLPPAVQP